MISISNPLIGKNEIKAVTKVLESHKISQGKEVAYAEKVFSKLCGTKYAIATNSGTSALHTALYAAGIKPGDEIITTPFTFIATANAIIMVGAIPVFVDIDPKTYNIDYQEIEKAITRRTKAIIAVNLYGQPADYDKISKIAKKYKLIVIEDAAQSINASFMDKKSGNLGDLGCFSFYATKNITCGEGGMISTDNKNYYLRAKQFINQGQKIGKSYAYLDIGYNYRMIDIQASILIEQFKKVDWVTKKRQQYAQKYNRAFQNVLGLEIPYTAPNREHVYHQYTLRITKSFPMNRDKLINYLQNKEVIARIYYPKPLYYFPHIKKLSRHEKCQNAERAADEVLSIPVHPSLKSTDIKYISDIIKSV